MKSMILGTKIGMTQIFDESGLSIPVTVVKSGPCTVVQVKTTEKDGYDAVKVGYGECKEKALNKPDMGQFKKNGLTATRYLREFRLDDCSKYNCGDVIKVEDMFNNGDKVDVTGTSKGKGYQGTVKRYGMHIGPKAHGSKYHRGVGSMGPTTTPGKVAKGKRMPGRMGGKRSTILNLDVVKVDAERGLLLIRGAVPGAKGSLLVIRNAVKAN
ncbi:MAG: 50S ribosomal protein L3 [Clostridia bacterium]|nr:50S ribosomal protein L3 [Clostridia bacterium]